MREVLLGLMGFAMCTFQGCAGGQTGDPGDAGETETCVMVARDIALEDETPLGFTAAEVLALAEGTDTAPLYPITSQAAPNGAPAIAPSEITVEVSYDGGAVQLHESTTPGNGLCQPDSQLTIEVTVHVQASDASVDETFPATLAGTPQVAWTLSSNQKVEKIVFSKFGSAGLIAGNDPDFLADPPVAQWPAQSPDCAYGYEVPSDEGNPSALDALELLGRASELNIDRNREPVTFGRTWEEDRIVEPLQMLVSGPKNICARPYEQTGEFSVSFDAMLALTGENLAFEHSVRFSAGPSSAPGIPWQVSTDHDCGSAGADFADTCGDSVDADVEPFDRVHESLSLVLFVRDGEKPGVDGTWELIGDTDDCELVQATDKSLCGDNFEVLLQRGMLTLR